MLKHTLGWSLPLALLIQAVSVSAGDWPWSWPTSTTQCENVQVALGGGLPPWTLIIAPLLSEPIIRIINPPLGSFNQTHPAITTIPLPLAAGTEYVVLVSDKEGYNQYSVNPTELQTVGPSSDDTCLAQANAIPLEFVYNVGGNTTECAKGFGLTWQDRVGKAPYSCTVIPLDTRYNPWDVAMPTETGQFYWKVNMTEGTRFAVMMNNGNGIGRGGVSGIFEVAGSNDSSCGIVQDHGTLPWPSGVETGTIGPVEAAPTTFTPSSLSTVFSTVVVSLVTVAVDPSGSIVPLKALGSSTTNKSGTNAGAIAGGVVGGVLGLALIRTMIWLLRRRRSKRRNTNPITPVDLAEHLGPGPSGPEPKIEPFPSPLPTADHHYGDPAAAYAAPSAYASPSAYSSYPRDDHSIGPESPLVSEGGASSLPPGLMRDTKLGAGYIPNSSSQPVSSSGGPPTSSAYSPTLPGGGERKGGRGQGQGQGQGSAQNLMLGRAATPEREYVHARDGGWVELPPMYQDVPR